METFDNNNQREMQQASTYARVSSWQALRNQAAIAAMQGFLSRQTYKADLTTLAKDSVRLANYLIEELKKQSV